MSYVYFNRIVFDREVEQNVQQLRPPARNCAQASLGELYAHLPEVAMLMDER